MVTWEARVPIDIQYAEGPDAHVVIEDAKARVRVKARASGLDADAIVWGWLAPEKRQGRLVETHDPVMGTLLSPVYTLVGRVT